MTLSPTPDPLDLFKAWFDEALAHEAIREPTAMTLATVDASGQPHARVVLLKEYGPRGFSFFTNTRSHKGEQMRANARAALCFYWMPLGRQVRVRGRVEPVSQEEADAYFATRPRESQLGAWASDQSAPLDLRETMVTRFEQVSREYEGREVPRPAHWSGYRVVPDAMEFWLAQPHRLHDRLLYRRAGDQWRVERLYP